MILKSLNNTEYDFVFTRDYDRTTNLFLAGRNIEIDTLPRDGLTFPENVNFYFEHLDKLGLAGVFQDGNQKPMHRQSTPREQIGVRVRCKYRLTDFGQRFVIACMPK